MVSLWFTTAWNSTLLPVPPIEDVLSSATDQGVVTCSAAQGVVAGTADQDIGTVAAIFGEHNVSRQPGRR